MTSSNQLKSVVSKKKFNGDYCGEIVVIGFTGDAKLIGNYLKKMFKIHPQGKYKMWSKKCRFNIEVSPHVIAHIETYPWTSRRDLKIDEVKPNSSHD